jgi:small-conductance mechanosensitive channel
VSSPEPSFKTSLGFKPDFPFERLLGFILSIVSILFLRPYIMEFVPSPYYSITVEGEDFIIFTELSIWTLILMVFVTFLTVFFIIPLTLYFRGLSEWEWNPTVVVFWMIMTRGSSLFFGEIADTNANLEAYTLILIDIVDSIFVLFMTVFLLRAYSNYFVPVISDWLTVGKTDTQYGPLLEIMGSLLIIVFGITNFLSTYHVDFGVLLAGVGVVGLVIALAAQDTLSNFFSGILLLLDQGFKTGDMIYFNETYCLIRDIGLRSTKIYDIVNHVMIIIPNNSLANQNILNLTRPDRYYRIRVEVGVSYDSDPDHVEKLLLEVAEQNSDIEQDDPTRMPLVRFQDFGDSSLTFVLVAWINNVIKIRQINSDLHHQVFDKLKGAGVTIAFPQRDVHIHEVPEPAITKSPRPASTKSSKPTTAKGPKAAAKKSPKRAAKKKK